MRWFSSPVAAASGAMEVRASFGLCHTGGGTNCVVDGDTICLESQNIRIADIDALETHDEDRLGLDRIYIEVKRYGATTSVHRPEVQGFVGSLVGLGASKGVTATLGSRTCPTHSR